MKFLLKLLVAAASMVGIILVLALFVDRTFEVKRSRAIPANREVTFAFFKNLENQEEFSSWLKQDSTTKIWYEGTPGEIGYKMHWESNDKSVGKGVQEIIAIEENERIEYRIEMSEPEAIQSDLVVKMKGMGTDRTKVIWHLKGEIPYPWNLTLLFKDVENEIGLGFEKGLKSAGPLIEKSVG